ncbi:hypothetical protein TanjilG_05509 [Lupinus angustifolius]|uniref:Uncharacterized protein n=1 Tax=Lupinus angustifolius TaxID=3871 RepID=A0A1J7IR14_LUPAN|nr:hypothetical protein TanjilG_05509 [Lupinus angustifolius]
MTQKNSDPQIPNSSDFPPIPKINKIRYPEISNSHQITNGSESKAIKSYERERGHSYTLDKQQQRK